MSEKITFCPFCGKRLAPDASFCVYCGKQVTVNQSLSEANSSFNAENRKGSRSFLPIAIALIALLLVGFGIKFVFSGNESKSYAINSTTVKTASSANKSSVVAPVNYSGWKTINIGEIASLQHPPTMEVQNDKYRSILGTPSPGYNEIILQQFGLNDMTPDARSRYARVLFKTTNNDSKTLLYDKLSFNQSELNELNTAFYLGVELAMNSNRLGNSKILTKEPTQIKTINGVDCVYNSYTRQRKNNPVVIVHFYRFFNNQYAHDITISYRESEKSYWTAPGNDIRNIINTLKIKAL